MKNYEGVDRLSGTEIAIIGMACRFPGARNLEEYWHLLQNGTQAISFLGDEELDPSGIDAPLSSHPNYVKAAPLLDDVESFDASFFGYSPKEAELMDPQHRLFLELAWEALEIAGYNSSTYPGSIGVYAGARTNTYLYNLISNPEAIKSLSAFEIGLGNDLSFLSGRVAYKLGLRGPAYSVQTACSTGLVAVHLACQSLLIDECQIALAGSIAVNVPQKTGYLYQEGGILSPDGCCRAFDERAAGTLFGSGAGIVVLKRLEDALADRDHIFAVIKGSAVNNDGSAKASFTAPSVDGQAEVIAETLLAAEVKPETVSYVESHGTGTQLGDPIEIRALTKAFRASTDKKNFCGIGSVKTNIGHLDAAAGIAGLIKTVLALKHRQLPPSLHFERPNPNIDFANSPFYVNTTLKEWEVAGAPRRAGVSSFGVGGTNAHVILEEAPEAEPSGESRPWHLLMLSGKTFGALEVATENLIDHLKQHPETNLSDVAYTLQSGRETFDYRRVISCSDLDHAVRALEMDPQRVFTEYRAARELPVIFMFPGGGAQYVNMGYDLYRSEPAFREQIDLCSQILRTQLGCDLREFLYAGDAQLAMMVDRMKSASIGLPALFVTEYALARLWMSWGVHPKAMIGHSLGEYVAACLSGVFSLEDALSLVVLRGRLFERLPRGAMLSVPLPENQVRTLMNGKLSLAAVNGPSHCVLSGPVEAIEEVADLLRARELEFRKLQIDVAAHSEMVVTILDPFSEFVNRLNLQKPQIPYISNVTGRWVTAEDATSPDYWVRHLRQTVRFGEGMEQLLQEPDSLLLEVGPGQTLSTLAKLQTGAQGARTVLGSMRHPNDRQSDVAYLLTTFGRLWLEGVDIDWRSFYAGELRRRVPLPTYPFERQRYWIKPETESVPRYVQASKRKNSNLASWFYVPSWKRTAVPQLNDNPAASSDWLIFVDECGIGALMAERLKETNHKVTVVKAADKFQRVNEDTYLINPGASEDYEAMLRSLQEEGRNPDRIIQLWSVTSDAVRSGRSFFEKAQNYGYYSMIFLAWALVKTKRRDLVHVEIVSNHMQEVNDEVPFPEKATLLGPCITISQEYPNIVCRSIDLVVPQMGARQLETLADRLIAELQYPSPDPIIAYRGNHRWVRHYEPLPLTESTNTVRSLRQNGVYLITGGLGGVGLILAEYLARTVQARLVLTGRTSFPERGQWAQWLQARGEEDEVSRKIRKIQALEKFGGEVLTAGVDVADEDQMRSLIAQIYERFGQLNGVLHAAGITSGPSLYRPVTEVGPAESEGQFKPKVHGVYVLEEVLKGRPVDFCLLFSSNAAVLGGLGFVAYAAANQFMDAFVSSRSKNESPVWLSANWDPWPEETKQYTGAQTSIDQYTMTQAESEEAFRRIACMGAGGQIVVSTGDLWSRLDLWVKRKVNPGGQGSDSETSIAAHQRPHLQTSYVAPRNEIERTVADIWQQVLGIQQVGIHDNFFDLGGHSLLVTQVIGRLRDALQIDLPLSQLFNFPTVADLAKVIAQTEAEIEDTKRVEILDMLSRLSEQEVDEELRKRTELDLD
jgi:phthiocerol/phenolphthiocerol synthesis type-I polyketide synthase E